MRNRVGTLLIFGLLVVGIALIAVWGRGTATERARRQRFVRQERRAGFGAYSMLIPSPAYMSGGLYMLYAPDGATWVRLRDAGAEAVLDIRRYALVEIMGSGQVRRYVGQSSAPRTRLR